MSKENIINLPRDFKGSRREYYKLLDLSDCVSFHRNGVAGEAFFTVKVGNQTETWDCKFLAIVPSASVHDKQGNYKYEKSFIRDIYVIDLNDPKTSWRGADSWQDEVWEKIIAHFRITGGDYKDFNPRSNRGGKL
jgi:hypothetical protein